MSDPTTGAHPDVDTLSDLDAGLLDAAMAARAGAHVAGCATCRDRVDLLQDTQAMLAGLPAVPMPADVAARIDTALAETAAAETAARGPAVGRDTPAATGDVTVLADRAGHRRRIDRRRWWPGAGVVAAGVALLFAGAVGLSAVKSGSGASGTSNRSSTTAGAVPRAAPARAPVASGADYSSTTLDAGVRRLLAGRSSPTGLPREVPKPSGSPRGPLAATAAAPVLDRLLGPAALQACVTELAGVPGVTPLAVDFARFQDKPAVVVVLPDSNPANVDAWVVGPACGPGQSDLLRYQVTPRS
ncbi:MAG: hypothetical protein DLM59_12620 [Pseudonocardiales bacterium]|nr:MAG: hypothetical protein DLM59_12620 [Pseudonocardiales bacterium]